MVEKGLRQRYTISCSIASFVGFGAEDDSTRSTKGAPSLQYTRSSAIELAPYGIRVNALAPGYVETPMTYDWIHAERRGRVPRGDPARSGVATVEDLNGAIAFLAGRAS
jgi:NAD(P)-dependent dehydrogenase (short-subunit alcohol dehydrogenase family)